ncbi:MAG: HAMP domain-containing protein [Proteobacteria bacterium]|nr:HAMP domain-containing protein [Pseudomonadota bacterium]
MLGIAGGLLAGHRMLNRVDIAGNVARAIVTGDLTGRLPVSGSGDEIDRLSATFNTMLDPIERLMAGLHEVSDNIAHDPRTPLSRIRAEAEDAARGAATLAEAKTALAAIIEDIDELLKVFAALPSIDQLDAGSSREQFQATDLSALLADLAELYEPVAREAKMALEMDIEPGAGLGLSLARAIAESHGGSLMLSDNHPGLRATITLPASAQV